MAVGGIAHVKLRIPAVAVVIETSAEMNLAAVATRHSGNKTRDVAGGCVCVNNSEHP